VGLSTRYKADWPQSAERFESWWLRRRTDRPLLRVTAPRNRPAGNTPRPVVPEDASQRHLSVDYLIRQHRYRFENTFFGGDAYPAVSAPIGPGSLALYLGSEPGFAKNTVWFKPCIDSLETTPMPEFDPESHWFRIHLEMIRRLHEVFAKDAFVAVPDIIESVDILAAMRGPMAFLFDLKDTPDQCHRWLQRINDLYMPHYNAFYDIVKASDGSSAFVYPSIWGRGRTCKVQCDSAAMLSPALFAEFYVPYVIEQIGQLDRVVFHLDGSDCICHADLLVAIKELHAIQWVPGAGQPDGGDECWYPLFEKILDGGKALEVRLEIDRVVPFVKRFGADGVYLLTTAPSEREARDLVESVTRMCHPPGPTA